MDSMTINEQEAARQERLSEVGTLSPCPFCGKARVQRNTYVRCNPCGINWLDEEMHLPNYLDRNPAAARSNPNGKAQESAHTTIEASTSAEDTTEDADAA